MSVEELASIKSNKCFIWLLYVMFLLLPAMILLFQFKTLPMVALHLLKHLTQIVFLNINTYYTQSNNINELALFANIKVHHLTLSPHI